MAEAAPGRIGRDDQGEARRENTTPNGGPHLDLGRLRLKTLCNSDFSIAETTWPTYPHTYLHCILNKRMGVSNLPAKNNGFRRAIVARAESRAEVQRPPTGIQIHLGMI